MAAFEIPLIAAAQRLTISLAGVSYNLVLKWNVPGNCWMMDIYDTADNLILGAVPLVTGVDLLEQFEYLSINGQLVAQTDHNKTAPPTFSNLGSTGHLYFVTSP